MSGSQRPERPAGAPSAPVGAAGRGSAAPRSARFAGAAFSASVLAAVVVPGNRLGAGVLLVAVVLALAAVAGGRRVAVVPPVEDLRYAARRSEERESDRRWRRAWGACALLLAAAPVLRDATWVVLPALAGALGFGSLAVAGGATWRGVARGFAAALRHAPRGPSVVLRSAAVAAPRDARARVAPALRGAALATLLVAVFGALFATGDRAFAQLAGEALPSGWDAGPMPLRALLFAVALALGGGLAGARGVGAASAPAGAPSWRLGAVEWAVALAALVVLFAAFVAVQFAVLFGGHDAVLRTAGLTYAEYAREGFGQLLAAATLTLAVAAAALRFSPPAARALVRALLAVLLALTVVVLVSALHRLDLYVDAFGATRLRLTAELTLLAVGALLALVLAALAAGRFAWLPRACAAVLAAALVGLVAVDPDRRIAERNLARGEPDLAYLSTLSADAVPVLPERVREAQRRRLADEDGVGGFSLARARARAALE
jgi:hypothetical protein